MTAGAWAWMAVFGIAAATFFGVAVVVAVRGVGDVGDLLRRDRRSGVRGLRRRSG